MKTPLIFDIKRTSSSDGPGIRTVVFFKGCDLSCFWCHNPEGISPLAQLAYFREKCISCGTCGKVCENALKGCVACGICAERCPVNARKLYGKQYSIDELFRIISSDKPYYDATDGGVTFSGGECMLYPEYLAEIAKRCVNDGISVAVDTAGYVPYESFETVLPYVDLFLYDIKCLDPELHQKGTGKENSLILQNLERLQRSGKTIIVRAPVIPGFNDGDELEKIKVFCLERDLPLELLKYHPFGEDKKIALRSV